MIKTLQDNLRASIKAKQQLLNNKEQLQIFEQAAMVVIDCYRRGGRLYIAGNGGSAADAQHLAAEFVSKLAKDRAPLPAEALTVDSSILTAIGNDYGYEYIFSRQIEGKMKAGDVFLGITASGCSANILNVLDKCREKQIRTIVFSGYKECSAKDKADYFIAAPGYRTCTIQEVHIVLEHTLCEVVENTIF